MKLLKSQLTNAQHARLTYRLTLDAGQTYESLFKPSTWGHVAREIPKGTIIEAVAHDGAWFAQLYVRASSDLDVVVGAISKTEFGDLPSRSADEYEVKFRGRAKWSVMRVADKALMIEGLDTRELAEAWLKNPVAKAA